MPKSSDPVAAMAVEIAKNDAEIEHKVRLLALDALHHAQYILDYGTPALKMQVIRSVLPAMTKELAREQEDEAITKMRAEMIEMFKEMRGSALPDSPITEDDELDADELAS